MTQNNNLLEKFHLDGIPPASRGVPQVMTQGETSDDEAMDWTTKGAMDAGEEPEIVYGSCQKLSAAGCLMSAWLIAAGNFLTLREQQHVDCDSRDSVLKQWSHGQWVRICR